MLFFFLRIRPPPISTRTYTLVPYTTLFRSSASSASDCPTPPPPAAISRSRRTRPPNVRGRAGSRAPPPNRASPRPEEHTSELQSPMRISYAVFSLQKKTSDGHHNSQTSPQCQVPTQS